MIKFSLSNKSKYVEGLILVTIIIVAVFVRIHKLDSAPYGTLVNEASFGYIAYSIAQTGKDELGNSLPLSFKAFGDYKLPMYGYALAPAVKLFGLSNYSVRLPFAISGIFITILIYLILKREFECSKPKVN
jgi:4-amino-4-deoxy-L-arabinose transferase-like glycosyltransferase